ncbi:MAG: ParB N-terminal domain-containing protein [Pseudomonadota bacterium]
MAKRRKLTAPSAAEIAALEEGFAAKPGGPLGQMAPPIAQVAGEAAALTPVTTPGDRAEAERNRVDAEALRAAQADGRILLELPLSEIAADELTRDRIDLDDEDMAELKRSIAANGLRLPVEVFELSEPDAETGHRWGLLSGYRRLAAVRALLGETGDAAYARIRALVREPGSVAAAYAAMVEENEVRADLTPYERGRVAVLAVGHGAFESIEAAVDGLFAAASKAKRSKIRSFALVHEELGDMLSFAPLLSERAGLRLAATIRAGFAAKLREALATGQGIDAGAEWAAMEPVLADAEESLTGPSSRGGRPRKSTRPSTRSEGPGEFRLANGITIKRESDSRGYAIRVTGPHVNLEVIELVMFEIKRLLEPER